MPSPTRTQLPSDRSPLLIQRQRSLLLIVDLQERLLPLIRESASIAWNVQRLIRGAQALGVSRLATEQYPEKLGASVAEVKELHPQAESKRMFSCRECGSSLEEQRQLGLDQLVLCGIETHVCILQSALDLLQQWQVFVVVDAVGSRFQLDHHTALERMAASGCQLTTTESVLFEWCETSDIDEFKAISRLVRHADGLG